MNTVVKALTPELFDRLIADQGRMAKPPKIIWGADAIGRRLGVSGDFVRDRLVREDGSPIKKKAGRYCVVEDDLVAFFRE